MRNYAEESRTTLSLSITVKDKQILRELAAKKNISIAALIHEWIEKNKRSEE